MCDGDSLFLSFIFGAIITFFLVLVGEGIAVDHMNDYPGLSEQLSEEQDRCEARPNVISCEWSEDKVTYVPEDKNLD
jgi:hypothetical protein